MKRSEAMWVMVREWLEKEQIEGIKSVICRQYFNKVFGVAVPA